MALRSGHYSLIASRISTTDASAKTVTCVNPFELLVHCFAALPECAGQVAMQFVSGSHRLSPFGFVKRWRFA